ncbi:hypothetical protein CMO89_01360 [Candidatus Woesearchaeota archaeon]|nr:hypothetical protein [Candidatus Woesearchaeota archaeon]|tara:strand:- start:6724 stop:8577 length:1854 start_codon:yes stop_codon:yes gene_type:complete
MKKQKLVLIFLIFLVLPVVYANEGHMKLLAVSESEHGYVGNIADLYLELKEGSGRVFLDTFPITKSDTQISTRFAKEIACDFLDMDCSNIDFIYTITADSAIIGGPSAGAAIAVLTVSMLKELEIDEEVSITGSINSGGFIGSVGGLKSKIDAAASIGIKKVMIPKGERFVKDDGEESVIIFSEDIISKIINETLEDDNGTIDIVVYGRSKGVEVKEVSELNEAVYEFTGMLLEEPAGDISIDLAYKDTMKSLAVLLCNRSKGLLEKVESFNVTNKTDFQAGTEEDAKNFTMLSEESFANQRYYSAASYCYGANVKYGHLLLNLQNLTNKDVLDIVYSMRKRASDVDDEIQEREIKSITDLETYMVVKERLIEAEDYLDRSWLDINNTGDSLYNLAYATERLYSVIAWSNFFGVEGEKFSFDKEIVRQSCIKKISEAEERYQYFSLFYPGLLDSTRKEIDHAYADLNNSDYELCLFKASKAKASANVVMTVLGTKEEQIKDVVEQKLEIVKKNIAKATKDMFPILGYSYYEYADSLKDSEPHSAMLYGEYALELSNLGMYFKERKKAYLSEVDFAEIDVELLYALLFGLCFGFLFGYMVRSRKSSKRKGKRLFIEIK